MVGIVDTFSDVSRERFIANYDFIDIARGMAMQTFYLGNEKKTTTLDYLLEDQVFWSNNKTQESTINGGLAKEMDLDFDVEFQLPRIIEGKALINLPFGVRGDAGPTTCTCYMIFKIRKYSGGEIELVNGTTETLTCSSVNPITSIACMQLDIPRTHFKKGDLLRLTVEVWGNRTAGAGTGFCAIGIDPKSRDPAANALPSGNETQAIFIVPFRIDV